MVLLQDTPLPSFYLIFGQSTHNTQPTAACDGIFHISISRLDSTTENVDAAHVHLYRQFWTFQSL